MTGYCFLAQFSTVPCDGRIVRAHLLPKQLLRREHPRNWRELAQDPRSFVYACGGLMGNAGCHGRHDSYQLVVPRAAIPERTEQFAAYLGLTWYLDRRYGMAQNVA